ncbi:MAG: SixA phosphatase family protein [Candidatus Puniceispirillaceae bacterium]
MAGSDLHARLIAESSLMARITLFRHAKAETPDLQTADVSRVLASRGRRNAAQMGQFIKEKGLLPDLVIVSTAARTRQTWEIASGHWPDIPVIFLDSIYEASATTIMAAIDSHGGECERVMVIGHNPGLVVLLHNLVDAPPSGVNMSYFPTSCVADIGFDVSRIKDIEPESGRLLSLIRARELG